MFPFVHNSSRMRSGFGAVAPWIFVLGVALGIVLAGRGWFGEDFFGRHRPAEDRGETDPAWRHLVAEDARHPIAVLRIVDGDTFVGRVRIWPDIELTTRVRLRGIDAPEMEAACAQERRQAEAARDALRGLLDGGRVAIFNIGPDKYAGRVVADVASARVANISAALLEGGFARRYDGGRREGWCASARAPS